jgi:hypothetical protein
MATSLRAALRPFALSLEQARVAAGIARPCTARSILGTVDVVRRHADITSGGLAALGGSVDAEVHSDGRVRFKVHVHDSGADSYSFHVTAVIRSDDGMAIACRWSGHVGGEFDPDSRNEDRDEEVFEPLIARRFDQMRSCRLDLIVDYESGIGGVFESVMDVVVRWMIGETIGFAGALIIFVGVEFGSLVTTGGLTAGARVIEGILWMAGPSGIVFSLAAHGIVLLGERSRELSDDEYRYALPVFGGTLPPKERLLVTDTIGGDDRPFTFPTVDGKVALNMGSAAYQDPRSFHVTHNDPNRRRSYGEVFIHELVHAWQIEHNGLGVTVIADALSSKVCELLGSDPYKYAPLGFPRYGEFNLEQQAQIVSDWFAKYTSDTSGIDGANAKADPYYRYIEANIRQANPDH